MPENDNNAWNVDNDDGTLISLAKLWYCLL